MQVANEKEGSAGSKHRTVALSTGLPRELGPEGVLKPEVGAPTALFSPTTNTVSPGSPWLCHRSKTDSEMPTRDPTVHIWGGPATNPREVWWSALAQAVP